MADEHVSMGTERQVVLVVDDSPATLGLLTDTLETIGVTVLVSPSGEHAVNLTQKITPDVVLMDALMPGLDGFETCRKLKAQPAFRHVPVIFMTGLSATEHIVKALEAGGVDFLTKPVSPDEVIARMRVHLANARATRVAQIALDKSRHHLIATDRQGKVIWSTPEANRLMANCLPNLSVSIDQLDPGAVAWLKARLSRSDRVTRTDHVVTQDGDVKLTIGYLGEASRNEHILRISEHDIRKDAELLTRRFQMTPREAEIACWLSQGKSNKEIGLILELSPRTVNKHLEAVFEKIGVDNRTSAATMIIRALTAPLFSQPD